MSTTIPINISITLHRGAGWDLNSDIFPEENIRWGNFKEPSGVGLYPTSFTV